jgi:hypothetical protein
MRFKTLDSSTLEFRLSFDHPSSNKNDYVEELQSSISDEELLNMRFSSPAFSKVSPVAQNLRWKLSPFPRQLPQRMTRLIVIRGQLLT